MDLPLLADIHGRQRARRGNHKLPPCISNDSRKYQGRKRVANLQAGLRLLIGKGCCYHNTAGRGTPVRQDQP